MEIVVCENAAVIVHQNLEQIPPQGISVVVENVSGKEQSGFLSLVRVATGEERFWVIEDGRGILPASELIVSERYKVVLVENDLRIPAGDIMVIEDGILGPCVLPFMKGADHLWKVVASIMGCVRTLREEIENHICGNDVV